MNVAYLQELRFSLSVTVGFTVVQERGVFTRAMIQSVSNCWLHSCTCVCEVESETCCSSVERSCQTTF